MNNTVKYINFASLAALLFTGCTADEYLRVDDVVDVAWYTNETGYQTDSPFLLCEGGYLTVMDASQGFISHEWRIEEGDNFAINDFDNLLPAVDQVDKSKGLTSSRAVETVCFGEVEDETTSRISKVTLYNVFPDKVKSHDSASPVEAYQDESGNWILKKEFEVKIYDNLKPAYTIYKQNGDIALKFEGDDEVPEDKEEWTKIEIGMGEILTIVDETDYAECAPIRTITMEGSDEKTLQQIEGTLSFSKQGKYSNHTIMTNRTLPLGAVTRNIPLVVEVVYADLQINTNTMTVDYGVSNHSVIAKLNGTTSSVPANMASLVEAHAYSGADNSDLGYTLQEVKLVEGSNNKLEFVFGDNEQLVGGDKVSIKFADIDDLVSSDGREMKAFDNTDDMFIVPDQSIIDAEYFSFEIAANFNGNGWYVTNDQMYENSGKGGIMHSELAYHGSKSCLIDFSKAISSETTPSIFVMNQGAGTYSNRLIKAVAGKYKLKYHLYLNTVSTSETPYYGIYLMETAANIYYENMEAPLPTKTSQWLEVEHIIELNKDVTMGQIKFDFPKTNVTESMKLYIDKIELIPMRSAN